MINSFILAPRYRLDDDSPWLEGIDPARQYWIWINGDVDFGVAVPGLSTTSLTDLKQIMGQFQQLQPGESLTLQRPAASVVLHCVGDNAYAIAMAYQGNPVWHLFDYETLYSLLMTAHPDWQCAPGDVALGRRQLNLSWQQPVAV